jgi:DNA replication protein DnaC
LAYSRELHEKAKAELKRRKTNAENDAAQRKQEMSEKYPEFQMIETELSKTGFEILSVYAGGKENTAEKLALIRKKNEELKNERTNLLKALKLPTDYFDVKYTCEKCQDTGVIEDYDEEKKVSYGSKYCECYLDILKRYAVNELTRSTPLELSSFDEFSLQYYPKAKTNGYSQYNEMSDVFNSCKKYAENFDTDSTSLYFYGRTGLGKTHLSLAIANEAIKKGYNVLYGSVINFLNKMEKEKFGRVEAPIDTEELLIDADLLILDDLGAEFSTAYTVSALYNVINSRVARGVPTIISSNLDLEELKSRYPESIASRIIGTFAVVQFIGNDIRQLINEE